MTFFVLGLPRTRTAWLANFLTYGDLFCYHEVINGTSSIEEYKEKLIGKGDSNTGLYFFDFEPHFPDAKIIIIESEIEKSVKFGKDIFNSDITESMIIGKKRLKNIPGLHIDVNDINYRLREIWEYVSDQEFDEERAKMLIKLNVQIMNPTDIDLNCINRFKQTINFIG